MLRTAKTIAVVGMSDKSTRASHNIGKIPGQQRLSRAAGESRSERPVLAMVHAIPILEAAQAAAREQTGAGIDLVDVFRASEFVPAIVDDVIRLGIPYLWLQDGVTDDEAVGRAQAAGVKCVQDDCIFREHARFASMH